MDIRFDILLLIFFIFSATILFLVIIILFNKWQNKKIRQFNAELLNYIGKQFINDDVSRKAAKKNKYLNNCRLFIEKYIDYCQIVTDNKITEKANLYFGNKKADKKYIKQLKSKRNFLRIQASVFLSYMQSAEIVAALENQLKIEKYDLVKLYLTEALARHRKASSVPVIVQTLFNATDWYKKRVLVILSGYDTMLHEFIVNSLNDDRSEIKDLIIHFAKDYPSEFLKKYLIDCAYYKPNPATLFTDTNIPENFSLLKESVSPYKCNQIKNLYTIKNLHEIVCILYKVSETESLPDNFESFARNKKYRFAFNIFKLILCKGTFREKFLWHFREEFLNTRQKELVLQIKILLTKKYLFDIILHQNSLNAQNATKALMRNYYSELCNNYFLWHPDFVIRNYALQAQAQQQTAQSIDLLIPHLLITETQKTAQHAISNILLAKPELNDFLTEKFHHEKDPVLRFAFANILANKLDYFLHLLKFEEGAEKKRTIAIIESLISTGLTSQIIEFLNLNRDKYVEFELIGIIKRILSAKTIGNSIYTRHIFDFLNNNVDKELEKELFAKISEIIETEITTTEQLSEYLFGNKETETILPVLTAIRRTILRTDFGRYLKPDILEKLELPVYKPVRPKREEVVEKDKIKILKFVHILVYLVFPALYTVWHFKIILQTPVLEQILFYLVILVFPVVYSLQHIGIIKKFKYWELLALLGILCVFPILNFLVAYGLITLTTFYLQAQFFIIDFNFTLIFYSFAINLIYFVLLTFSFLGLNQQVRFASTKKNSFLYKDRVLPSISIVAPAYAEEENIIESVNSQLNLQYPDYELVVVSDGSPDNTLKVLIDYFNLQRVDVFVEQKISTQPIRGIYKNAKDFPKLTVVDKVNGGKADALNVGINVAKNEYFCGIDSDSLLEPLALIKLASMILNSDKESVAFGGNILPINSCKVHKGKLETIEIPKEPLAAFQTIEYLRAFMAGRVGWAYLNSLLIISGAFGLFKKDRVIEMGGYLTSKSKFKKDTVGEDMELVVRLNRFMLENNLPYAIHYCYDANCWTEVPELMKMQQIERKSWKNEIAYFITSMLYLDKLISKETTENWQKKILALVHVHERMRILINQRDRWHRGLIDILNFHKDMLFRPRYKQIGMVSLPYFFIFEMVGPLFEFQGYVMVLFAALLGMLNVKMALLLFITSIMMGIIISLSSLLIAEKEMSLFSRDEIGKLIFYAFVENFGPRQVASFWRIKGFFSSMELPKGWGQMIRKSKPIVVVALANDELRERTVKELEKLDCKVIACTDGNSAMENIKKENLKCAVLDENLSIINAISICRDLKSIPAKRNIPVAVVSSNTEYMNEENQLLKDLLIHPVTESDAVQKLEKIIIFAKQKINT